MAPELIAAVRDAHVPRAAGLDPMWADAEPRILAYLKAAGFDDSARMPRFLAAIDE